MAINPKFHRICVVFTERGKIKLTGVKKILVAMRDEAKVQHQATMDITLDNINRLKNKAERRTE